MPKQPTVDMSCLRAAALVQSNLLVTVVKNINANHSLGTSPLTDDEAEAIRLDHDTKYANRLNGAHAKAEWKAAQQAMKGHLRDEAHVVNVAAYNKPNAVELITLSGFSPTDTTPHPAPRPGTPTATLIAHPGRMIEVRIDHAGHRESFAIVWCENAEPKAEVNGDHITLLAPANIITDGHQHEDIQVSSSADKVYVIVLAQNATGMSAFSAMVSTKVLE